MTSCFDRHVRCLTLKALLPKIVTSGTCILSLRDNYLVLRVRRITDSSYDNVTWKKHNEQNTVCCVVVG